MLTSPGIATGEVLNSTSDEMADADSGSSPE
jgi:hypothetical protein